MNPTDHFRPRPIKVVAIVLFGIGMAGLAAWCFGQYRLEVAHRRALERDLAGECRAPVRPQARGLLPCVPRWEGVARSDRRLVQGRSTEIVLDFENPSPSSPCDAVARLTGGGFDLAPGADISRRMEKTRDRLSWSLTPREQGDQTIAISVLSEERRFGFFVSTSRTIPEDVTGVVGIFSVLFSVVVAAVTHLSKPQTAKPEVDAYEAVRHQSGGVASAFMTWAGRGVPDEFIENEPSLELMLKDGYTFFKERSDVLSRRFRNQNLHTTVLIVHPDSPVLGAVATMDPRKNVAGKQRSDCLEAVEAMKRIRDELAKEKIDISDRARFYGYDSVPTWIGFLGGNKGFISLYPSAPFRGDLLTLEVLGGDGVSGTGEVFERYRSDYRDVLRMASERGSLFEYPHQHPAQAESG